MTKALIITGASRGIGHATATRFHNEGWDVINLSRTPCDIEGVTNLTCDFTQPDWTQSLTLPNLSVYEKIALVHNAGTLTSDQVQALPTDQLQQTLAVNVLAPNALNQIVIPHLKPGSAIIYLGSTLSEKAVPNCASYVVSKHAIVGLMKATCQDLAGTDIHTCCVCPGITDTEMLRERAGHSDKILAQLANIQVCGRLASTIEISNVIWFCSTNSVINGAVIHSNLGQREQ